MNYKLTAEARRKIADSLEYWINNVVYDENIRKGIVESSGYQTVWINSESWICVNEDNNMVEWKKFPKFVPETIGQTYEVEREFEHNGVLISKIETLVWKGKIEKWVSHGVKVFRPISKES